MLTEEEAKTKRCCGPVGCGKILNPGPRRFGYQSTGPEERTGLAVASAFAADRVCIGSACMAWRWDGEIHERWAKQHNFHPWKDIPGAPLAESEFPRPDGDGWELEKFYPAANCIMVTWRRPLRAEDRRGHCGLAGKP